MRPSKRSIWQNRLYAHDCFAGQSPFSPQIQYQVFYGLRDVLYPLIHEEEADVAYPMQSEESDKITLVEIYPAATFGRLCCYRTGYKGRGDAEEDRRKENLSVLEPEFGFDLDDKQRVVESEDALDSLCAAARAGFNGSIDGDACVEGTIFV